MNWNYVNLDMINLQQILALKDRMLDNTSVTISKQEDIILDATKSCRFPENPDSVNMPPVADDISFSQMSLLRAKIKRTLGR